MNASLYVPIGTLDLYKSTPGWNEFVFIEESDFQNAIEQTESEIMEKERFTISGQSTKDPVTGINVIKMTDGSVKKVIVK